MKIEHQLNNPFGDLVAVFLSDAMRREFRVTRQAATLVVHQKVNGGWRKAGWRMRDLAIGFVEVKGLEVSA